MCGILVTANLERAFRHTDLDSLRARGPDALGFWCADQVTIGQTRLAIIGLDERANGPFENNTHVLAYNGEIYNFHHIRRQVQRETDQDLHGANDAQVLLAAWTLWGEALLPKLRGFWAFVAYNKTDGTLTLVRDQLGIKPLYYVARGKQLAAASTIRALLEIWPNERSLDFEALSEYAAYQFTFGQKTFISGLLRVPPGHVVEFCTRTGSTVVRQYEDIFAPSSDESRPLDRNWLIETRQVLEDCVGESLISDTPITTLCSGGIDSSLITRLVDPEVAFHCNYSDPECNETFFAREVVQGTRTRLYVVNGEERFDLVAKLASIVEDFDDLTIGSVVLPIDDLFSHVRRRYKVLLTGTGGDELFGGYVRYQLALGDCYQDSYRGLFERMRPLRTVVDRFEMTHRKGDPKYFRFFDPQVEGTFRKAYEECRVAGDDLHAMLTFDRRYFLAGLLNIDDKMAGRHSLECRPSLLHQDFVKQVVALNPTAVLTGIQLKSVLRSLAEPYLPPSVTRRSDKMGFTTPIGTFVQNSAHLIREQLSTSPFAEFYDTHALALGGTEKFSREVFGLLMVDLWLNRYAS